jgi:hypothetical protein
VTTSRTDFHVRIRDRSGKKCRYRVWIEPGLNGCHVPPKDKKGLIVSASTPYSEEELDTLVHETTHALAFKEKKAALIAQAVTKVLWGAGYRRAKT